MVLEDYESSYEELMSKCGMSILEIQRARTLTIEAYKSIHQMTPIYTKEMFNIKVTPYDLRDPKAETTKFLTYEENRICNSLSIHIENAGSLAIFKDRKIKLHRFF